MKKKLRLSYTILFSIVLVGVILALTGSSPWIISTVLAAIVVCSILILNMWMDFVLSMLEKSNKLLNRTENNEKWSLTNLEILSANQEQALKKISRSAELISNLTHPEKVISDPLWSSEDPIGKALKSITAEMQKIKEEDSMRNWVTEGLARFSTILRHKAEMKEYAYSIISNLIQYMNANQGAMFIEYKDVENERYLEMVACYAYDRRKFLESRISEGQGILGQCMLEKDFILITEVPKDYAKITSGLGEATPRSVVVSPLIYNQTFFGLIEMAFFEVPNEHHIDFLKKVSEDIASEIYSLKTIDHTKGLLEESNTLTQELQTREEEMRHNMEELAATQEEMSRKQMELSGIINAIDSTLATAELNERGRIIRHNAILEQFMEFNHDELSTMSYPLLLGDSNDTSWNKILHGQVKSGDFRTRSKSGKEVWLSITFTPIDDGSGSARLLCMIQNITQKKLKEKEFERLSLVANNTDNSVIITDGKGLIEYVNAGFTKMTGYEPIDVIGKTPGSMLQGPLTDKKIVQKLREQLQAGVPIYEEILNYNKRKNTYWVSLAINPVKDEAGNIQKYISIQSDITQTKIKALDFHQKMQALSRSNAIAELDRNGVLIDINDNYLELLDYSREELIGKPYSVLTKKDTTFQKMLDTIDEHGLQSGVFSRYDKRGNRHHMKLMDYPVLNVHGEIEKIIEFGLDVSNEKRLEKEAERREAELQNYLKGVNNTIASAEFDMDGRFMQGNEIFLKVMGYSADELEDKNYNFIMGDDPAVVMMWESLRVGKFFSGEFKMKNKLDKELWLTGTFNPMIIEGGTPEKIIMFAQFTTQEKEKLNDLNAMVQALKSTLPVIEFNVDFQCKTANEKALKIFGLSRIELRSKNVLDFVSPDFQESWNDIKNEILANDFTSFHIPFKAGHNTINYEVSISVARTADGAIGKIIMLLVKEVYERVSMLAIN